MDKYKDFPEPPRIMSDLEGESYFQNMLDQITQFQPDEIVAVSRSGLSYAMWIAQILKLPVGVYYPKTYRLITEENSRRIVFVDDNILQGSTYQDCKHFMNTRLPEVEWRWAVLFSDWHTPEAVRNEIIQGVRLPYFAEEPVWGSRKVSSAYGVRYRDEDSI